MDMPMKSMDMHMSFYLGKDTIVLFSGWPERSLGMYVLAILLVLFLGAAFEVLSMFPPSKPGTTKPVLEALTHATFYAIRMCFVYMVMLSVMSYNLGIFLAAIAGHVIGVFIVKLCALSKEIERNHMSSNGISFKI